MTVDALILHALERGEFLEGLSRALTRSGVQLTHIPLQEFLKTKQSSVPPALVIVIEDGGTPTHEEIGPVLGKIKQTYPAAGVIFAVETSYIQLPDKLPLEYYNFSNWKGNSDDIRIESLTRWIAELSDSDDSEILFRNIKVLKLAGFIEAVLNSREINYIGELVTKTPQDMRNMGELSQSQIRAIEASLKSNGLSFGMELPNWAPSEVNLAIERRETARRILALRQSPLGSKFVPSDGVLRIDPSGDQSDAEMANTSMARQLHDEVRKKISNLESIAGNLSNQVGWSGLSEVVSNLNILLSRPSKYVPEVLGSLYGAALELGSYLEMDESVRKGDSLFAEPLDATILRPLKDAVKTLSPWLRLFPSIQELDHELGQFFSSKDLINSSEMAISFADRLNVLAHQDVIALYRLLGAKERGAFSGKKAGSRGILSVRNMVIASASLFATIMIGAVENDIASKSKLIQNIGSFFAHASDPILELMAHLPKDIQLAIEALIDETKNNPGVIPDRQSEIIESKPVRKKPRAN
ncbi:MAG: hypothetical protein V4574_16245 [Pseudomonadota bacterium]